MQWLGGYLIQLIRKPWHPWQPHAPRHPHSHLLGRHCGIRGASQGDCLPQQHSQGPDITFNSTLIVHECLCCLNHKRMRKRWLLTGLTIHRVQSGCSPGLDQFDIPNPPNFAPGEINFTLPRVTKTVLPVSPTIKTFLAQTALW